MQVPFVGAVSETQSLTEPLRGQARAAPIVHRTVVALPAVPLNWDFDYDATVRPTVCGHRVFATVVLLLISDRLPRNRDERHLARISVVVARLFWNGVITGIFETSEQRAQGVDFATVHKYTSEEGKDLPVISGSVLFEEPVKCDPWSRQSINLRDLEYFAVVGLRTSYHPVPSIHRLIAE